MGFFTENKEVIEELRSKYRIIEINPVLAEIKLKESFNRVLDNHPPKPKDILVDGKLESFISIEYKKRISKYDYKGAVEYANKFSLIACSQIPELAKKHIADDIDFYRFSSTFKTLVDEFRLTVPSEILLISVASISNHNFLFQK